jgi:transaldolase
MGRIGAFIADNKLGDGKNAGEKATLASQRALRKLLADGGQDVRQIGASIRNGNQVNDLLGLDVFTIPTGAAKSFIELNPAPDTIVDKTGNDPAVSFGAGIDAAAEGLNCFWDISAEFKEATAATAALDANSATAADVMATLAINGAGDMFPQFSGEEAAKVNSDGKIPVHAEWQSRVKADTASWDGMLTAAALASFTKDQNALDARISGLL